MTGPTKPFIEELDDFFASEQAKRDTDKPKSRQTPHKRAVKAICAALRMLSPKPIIAIRNVGVAQYRDPRTRQMKQYSYGKKGEGDIGVTWMGQAFEIEVKVGRDVQRASQIEHQQKFEAAGGVYFIASDAAQAIEQMLAWRQRRDSRP